MSDIVIGYDGSAGADHAADEAATLARALGDRLVLVFSFEATRAGGEVADLDDAINERGRAVLEKGRSRCSGAGLEIELRQLELSPADGLIAVADELDARMIVTGSYGEHPLKGALLGSTPYRLVHLSNRPVLVVRAPQA
jgi:nucleotide-binding universal stress UspA family protein